MHRHRFLRETRRSAGPALACFALFLASLAPAAAQPLPEDSYKTGERLRASFRPVVAEPRKSTVRILSDGEPAALGVVVSKDGFILTKGSLLRGEISIRTASGREAAAERIAADASSDLALLKTDATDLVPAEWSDREPGVGSWLATVGEGRSPAGIGVVGVAGRVIQPQRGVLGIILDESRDAKVRQILPGTAAETAGLQVGDVITAVAGEAVATRDALLERLAKYSPGDSLDLVIRRGEKTEEVNATLGNEMTAMVDRQSRQNMMGGPVSVRSGGFDLAFQHDTVLRPEDCGGPVVDLSGRVVGINIARAGRVETYALPASSVRPILARLMGAESQTARK